MPIFDAYTLVGAWPEAEVDLTIDTLSEAMAARGVTRCLLTHTTAVFYDSRLGNDEAVKLAEVHPSVQPVAVINPLHYPHCIAETERCLKQGIKVFRLCPREHGYPLSGSVGPLRELFRTLEPARLLQVDLVGLPAPVLTADVEDLLPCPTLFSVNGDSLGTIIHAARNGPNVYVDTSQLVAGGAIESAVELLGAERLIFGSASPLRMLGPAVMSVQYAELSEGDRQAVFEDNLVKVLTRL